MMEIDLDIDTDDAILRLAANGGQIDIAVWPELLERLIHRLEKIVQNDFPIPHIPPPPQSSNPPSSPPQIESQTELASQSDSTPALDTELSQSANKENSPPTPKKPSTTNAEVCDGTLPPQILSLLNTVIETLRTYFTKYPPHTMQRLSELILAPKEHYRTLPAFLHAVDRVVHVTSGANTYPLPPAVPDALGAKVLSNGISTGTDPSSISWGNSTNTLLGSDESLGGALLTPISWIKNASVAHGNGNGNGHLKLDMDGEVKTESTETIDGPNGPGGIETVSVSVNGIPSTVLTPAPVEGTGLRAEGGVTQGELLRQEQRAGVVPATQLAGVRMPSEDGRGEEDEAPHARGPEDIGMEDMGPQAAGSIGLAMHGIDVEAAVGRRGGSRTDVEEPSGEKEAPTTPKREAEEDLEGHSKKARNEADSEMVIVDADGRTEDEPKFGQRGENKGSDAIDTSSV